MATLRRQRADGTYELVEMYGKFVKLKELYIAQSDNITTIPIQNSFTKVTDIINVYCEGLKLVENDNFTISVDNRTIELKDWAIKIGDKIEVEIFKNATDVDRLVSGSQLEDFSVDKIKLSQALQDEISNGGNAVNAVKSVNNILPDENGNTTLTAEHIKTKFGKTSGFLKQEEYQYLRASQSAIDTFILEAISDGHLYYEIIEGRSTLDQLFYGLITSSNEMYFEYDSSYIDNINQSIGHNFIWYGESQIKINKNIAEMMILSPPPIPSIKFLYKTTFSKGSLLSIAKLNIDEKFEEINNELDSDYVITSPKLPESIDYKDGFTFFQPSKTGDTSTGVNYQQEWYNYLTTQFPHIISDNVNISEMSHSIKVFTFHRYVSGKGTTPHEKIRQQEIHIVHPVDGTVYKFERLCSTTTWSIKMTYDFKKPSIKSINSILPDENGNVNIEMQGGGNSFFKSYNLPTTTVGQKVWNLPADSYDSNADSIVVFYNGNLLGSDEYTITGNVASGYQVNMENPIEEIEDNNIIAIVLRNARSDEPNEMSGLLLTDDSVNMGKLGQDVKDAIANAGSKVDIIDNLTSDRTDAVVSARVSKMIYDEIGYIDNRIDEHSLEKASSNSTGHVKPDDITTKVDATTGKISVITANNYDGGIEKVASAEIIKNLKGQFDNHIGDNTRHLTTAQKNQLHAMNAMPLIDGRALVDGVTDIISLNPTQLREVCASYIGYGKASFFTNLGSGGVSSTYGAYGVLTVTIPWTDNSGGFVSVIVETATATLKRYESSPTTWTVWKVIQSTDVDVAQLFQSVSSGKALVANAITGKGVSTSTTAEFATMASNISAIKTTGKVQQGTFILPSISQTGNATVDILLTNGIQPKHISTALAGMMMVNGFSTSAFQENGTYFVNSIQLLSDRVRLTIIRGSVAIDRTSQAFSYFFSE